MIRVINLSLQVTNQISKMTFKYLYNNLSGNIFKLADIDCVFSLIMRKNLRNIQVGPAKLVRETLMNSLVSLLHSYRLNVVNINSNTIPNLLKDFDLS